MPEDRIHPRQHGTIPARAVDAKAAEAGRCLSTGPPRRARLTAT